MIRKSEYQENLGRSLDLYTGRSLGGGSRINQMFYTRGLPAEYDAWAAAGRKGWSWEEFRPYFLKSEDAVGYGPIEGVHATAGEWKNRPLDRLYFRCFEQTLRGVEKLGLPYIPDINSPTHPPFGCGRVFFTIDKNSHRSSTFHAFLPASLALKRKSNLHICTDTLVERLVLESLPDGTSVVRGVQMISGGGRKTVKVEQEVIMSAGPLANPQILMLSGIGPAEHLKDHDIKIMQDLPAVGSNLQDHLGVSIAWNIPMSDSLVSLQAKPWLFFIALFQYLIWGTGLLLVPVSQLFLFLHTKILDESGTPVKASKAFSEPIPDVEIMPMAYDSSDQPFPKTKGVYSLLNCLLRPKSHGTVRLTSSDPNAPLSIDLRYLSDPKDITPLRASLKFSLRLRDKMREQGYKLVDWQVPASESDEDLDRFIQHSNRNRTTYHYSSTCRMAPEHDPMGGGVVDDELKVYGVTNLRVADSSIFPWIPATHLQAPTVAVAEKCADMLRMKA
ncbi:hypothetical protein PHLCEN_2v8543 [Hermanssonia centrifuga]|uniref:Glucose-methanol-choline oxidoreductase N-terminal domain-containing protein n=1 Tax=Hermanssonia centrifuga TaxID=98765 RepID=A0A2R6NU20_9APHY|nr:hypothetical protein PHLCEN_2v8543 [Hermanssonia centrifuga]